MNAADSGPLTLALETASQPGSLALLSGSQVIAERPFQPAQRTTAQFPSQVLEIGRPYGILPADIQRLAVCHGPGSFTGLRIGIVLAKTWSYLRGVPLVAVPTLELLAAQAADWIHGQIPGRPQSETGVIPSPPHDPVEIAATLDAQRREWFVACYRWVAPGAERSAESVPHLTSLQPLQTVRPADWLSTLPAGCWLTGPGLAQRDLPPVPVDLRLVPPAHHRLSAAMLGRLAVARFAAGDTVDRWRLTPLYGRPSAAEEKRQSTSAS